MQCADAGGAGGGIDHVGALRARAANEGRNPKWTSYEKLRNVIEKRMFSQVEDLLPVISFDSKKNSETEKKHDNFVARMTELVRLQPEDRVLDVVAGSTAVVAA